MENINKAKLIAIQIRLINDPRIYFQYEGQNLSNKNQVIMYELIKN